MNIWSYNTPTVSIDFVLEDFEFISLFLRAAYVAQFGRECFVEMHGYELHLIDTLGIEIPRVAVSIGNDFALSEVCCPYCEMLHHTMSKI